MSSGESAESCQACEAPPPPSAPDGALRMVLLGRTGSGRSSSGNVILGRSAFPVAVSPCSVTQLCERQTGTVDGRSVSVIDTPGFFHTHLSPREVMSEVGRSVVLSSPGPHVFVVTLRPGRFTSEERDSLEWIRATFGPGVTRFTVVLFTWGDHLRGKPIQDFVEMSDELSEFVSSCRGGHHVFDNSQQDERSESSQQVEQLLQKIHSMVESNAGRYYGNGMFKDAEAAVRNVQQRILGDLGRKVASPQKCAAKGAERRREEEEEQQRKREEKLFWCELLTALGRGAAEGAGVLGKDEGKALKKVKVVEKAAALAASPLSVSAAAKAVGGAFREGSKVLYKHRKTFLH